MKLTKISARNLKGQTFDLSLASINFIVGSNFAGKTARTDAVRLLLLGYLPELGKQHRATFGLASGRQMEVSGEFEDESKIYRKWSAVGSTIKMETNIAEDDAASHVAVMLNAETYFALSDRERVNYVFANCRMDEKLTIRGIMDSVIKESGISWQHASTRDETVQEFVEGSIVTMAERAKTAKDYASRMEKTVQGLATLRAQDAAPTENVNDLTARRDTLKTKLNALIAEKAVFEAGRNAEIINKRRRDELAANIAPKDQIIARRKALAIRSDEKENELTQVDVIAPEEVEELRSKERETSLAIAGIVRDLKQVRDSLVRNESDLAGVDGKDKCPFCGASGDGWKVLKTAEINSALAGLRVKETQLAEHAENVRVAALELQDRLAAGVRMVAARSSINAEIVKLEREMETLENQLVVIKAKEEELAALGGSETTTDALAKSNAIQANIATEQTAISEIDRKLAAIAARDGELKRLAEAEKQRDEAKEEEKQIKTALELLRETQRKMVADAFGPLLATANGFFGSIFRTPIAYNDGEIGTWRDGVWVGHRTFSGTEKALCYSAIQMALASKSPTKIMMIDELGRLDPTNVDKLIECVAKAVEAKRIDQFIGIAPIAPVTAGSISDCQTVSVS